MRTSLNLGSGPDYRPGAVNVDRWRASTHHAGETAPPDLLADAHHLPVKDSTLGHVRASHVIEHLERPLDALREAKRVLEPGGTLYVEVPDANRTPAERDDHLYSWTPDTLTNIVEQAGFEVVEYERHEREWPNSTGQVHHVECRI